MQRAKILILKCLVGSRAHGLDTKDSDYDYRGVYVEPTKKILSLGYKYKGSHWLEGKEDQTTYEIGHFLHLALKCNPTILEVFMAPIVRDEEYERSYIAGAFGCGETNTDALDILDYCKRLKFGNELRKLFTHVWNPKDAFTSFVGYGLNQRKKMLDKKDDRPRKYAVAYLRTVWNLYDLLVTGKFSLNIVDPDFKKELQEIKSGGRPLDLGYVINRAENLRAKAERVLPLCDHKADPEKVNEFLLKIRQVYF